MANSKVRLVSDGTPMGTKILIDGEEAKLPVLEIHYTVQGGEMGQLTLVLLADKVELDISEDQTTWSLLKPPKKSPTPKWFGSEG